LDVPTSFSTRTVTERHYGLVKVRSREGVEGIGFCYVGSRGGDVFARCIGGDLLIRQFHLRVQRGNRRVVPATSACGTSA
jgi:L-alanine-DL-glutamate epimerase-like enolase superfamily enzyme